VPGFDQGLRAEGKAEAVRLWRATRVLAGVGGSQRVDGLEAPLTGRDAELRTVRELFHAAAGPRVPRLVLVSGPAGVGKSRLGWEFEKYTDGLAEDVWWHRGRCLSYGDGVAFWALAEMVRQRLGIAEEDPAEVAAAKLAEGLDRFVPDPAERAYVGRGWAGCSASLLRAMARARWAGRSCSPGGGCSSSGWPRRSRWCWWSRTPSTPTPGCSTSSII
jgi:AAA ATPase domain